MSNHTENSHKYQFTWHPNTWRGQGKVCQNRCQTSAWMSWEVAEKLEAKGKGKNGIEFSREMNKVEEGDQRRKNWYLPWCLGEKIAIEIENWAKGVCLLILLSLLKFILRSQTCSQQKHSPRNGISPLEEVLIWCLLLHKDSKYPLWPTCTPKQERIKIHAQKNEVAIWEVIAASASD